MLELAFIKNLPKCSNALSPYFTYCIALLLLLLTGHKYIRITEGGQPEQPTSQQEKWYRIKSDNSLSVCSK